MAFQSFHACSKSFRLEGISKISASSLISFPSSLAEQSKSEKNDSMTSVAEMEEFLNEEILVRNSASFD